MAATCATVEPEEALARGLSSRLTRAKRSWTDLQQPGGFSESSSSRCDRNQVQGVLHKRPSLEVASLPLSRMGAERAIPFDVTALRGAAAAAVAEYNTPWGPSLQLTEPDAPHEAQPAGPAQSGSARESGSQDNGPAAHPKEEGGVSRGYSQHLDAAAEQQDAAGSVFTQRGCPPHGAKAICGRRPRMEDAYTAVPFLLEVPVPVLKLADTEILPARIAPQLRSQSASPKAGASETQSQQGTAHANSETTGPSQGAPSEAFTAEEEEESYLETLHFFGVFDGHGGAEAALHCAQTLHQRIAEALAATIDPDTESSAQGLSLEGSETELESQNLLTMPSGLPAVLAPVDEERTETSSDHLVEDALNQERRESQEEGKIEGLACTSASFESALTSAFNRTDEEFGKADNAALVGTTAVVALVGSRQLYVANCGDSRAVLCRSGQAIPLTDDHKAAREDETARVEAAGGHILYWNGVRVMGVLAVSRAIGDHCLRPFVIAQPEVTILVRRPEDEILLLASDGLWDVLNNQEACTLAKRCLRRARQRGASRQSAARIAATVLTRAAVDRGSRDNVTVLVVDLSVGVLDDNDISRMPSAAVPDQATA